jgi:CheY-like chemotaxis protein
LSWSPSVELRSLFADVLGEAARCFEQPAAPRGPELLRLAAADAALLGYDTLSVSLKSLSGRFHESGRPAPPSAAVARGLDSLAHAVERGGQVTRELDSLNGILTERSPVIVPSPDFGASAPREAVPSPEAPVPAAPPAAPAARVYFESAPPPRPSVPAPAAAASPASAMAAGRAVLVDPAPVNRAALARLLRRLRWDVREFDAVQPALEAVARGEADVLIADPRRLRLDPASLVAEVRRRAGGRTVPVAFVVEDSGARDEPDLLRAGAATLVRRPTDEATLRRVLEALRPLGGSA